MTQKHSLQPTAYSVYFYMEPSIATRKYTCTAICNSNCLQKLTHCYGCYGCRVGSRFQLQYSAGQLGPGVSSQLLLNNSILFHATNSTIFLIGGKPDNALVRWINWIDVLPCHVCVCGVSCVCVWFVCVVCTCGVCMRCALNSLLQASPYKAKLPSMDNTRWSSSMASPGVFGAWEESLRQTWLVANSFWG